MKMTEGFSIQSPEQTIIRFAYYPDAAPNTVKAFQEALPFTQSFLHARVSGNEIWTPDAPRLDIIQENATVFALPGEVVIGPVKPARAKTAGCMGIYYGEGQGLDACNVFAKVFDEDMELLQVLGNTIWKQGARTLSFKSL